MAYFGWRNGLYRVVKWLISGAKIAAFRDKHCGSGDYYILHITFFAVQSVSYVAERFAFWISLFNFLKFYNDHRFLDEPSGKAERNRLNRLKRHP